MYAAVVKLNPLTNAVRTTTQHHDFFVVGRRSLTLLLVSRIHVSGIRGELSRTGIYTLVNGANTAGMATGPHIALSALEQFSQTAV